MLIILINSKNDLDQRLTQLRREVLARGYDRHPSLLHNVSELPAELQSPAVTNLVKAKALETIMAFPAQIQHGWKYVPKQALLFTSTEVIHLMASIWPDQEPQITSVNGRDLMYMRVSLLLLYGSLEIIAHGSDTLDQISMEFNTVAWYRMSEQLDKVLQASKATPCKQFENIIISANIRQDIKKLPFKFSNSVYMFGQLPGEELEELVFQPAINKRWLILGRRPLISNTVLLLTTNFMMVIQEDPSVKLGWIITYIPRSNITRIQNQPGSLWNELTIQLDREKQTKEYKLALKDEVTQAWGEKWIGHSGQWIDLPAEVKKQV